MRNCDSLENNITLYVNYTCLREKKSRLTEASDSVQVTLLGRVVGTPMILRQLHQFSPGSVEGSGSLETLWPHPGLWCPLQGTPKCLALGSPFRLEGALERKPFADSGLGYGAWARSFPQAAFHLSLTLNSFVTWTLLLAGIVFLFGNLFFHSHHFCPWAAQSCKYTHAGFTFCNQLRLSTITQWKSNHVLLTSEPYFLTHYVRQHRGINAHP